MPIASNINMTKNPYDTSLLFFFSHLKDVNVIKKKYIYISTFFKQNGKNVINFKPGGFDLFFC